MLPMTPQLRDYQESAVTQTLAHLSEVRTVGVVLPARSGKTVVIAELIRRMGVPTVVIAHRTELLSQASAALADVGIRHRVIGSKELQRDCVNEHLERVKRNFIDPTARVAIASVDTLKNCDPRDPFIASVRLSMIDECFPAGTLVDGKPIETLRPGDAVWAFNEDTGQMERRRVVRLFNNPMPEVMIRFSAAGRQIECTPGHPVWTQRGWVKAAHLTTADHVLLHQLRRPHAESERGSTLPLPQDWEDLLQYQMRHGVPGSASGPSQEGRATCRLLPHVRQAVSRDPQLQEDRTGVLQPGVLLGLPLAGFLDNHERHQSRACLRAHAGEQPDEANGDSGEGEPNLAQYWARASRAGRQWAPSDLGRGAHAPATVAVRLHHAVQGSDRVPGHLPVRLQVGPWACGVEAGCGDRRGEPFDLRAPGPGQKEGAVLGWARLDRVEVYQPASAGGTDAGPHAGRVFNIEVEGLHTYVANGIVVHNCHHLLAENKWGKAVALLSPESKVVGLTATFLRADGKGLGLEADGLVERLVIGPSPRELIQRGFICPWRPVMSSSGVDLSGVALSSDGDFNQGQVRKAVHKNSRLVGDVVKEYQKRCAGLRGMTFCVDVDAAVEQAEAFRAAGVPAEVVTGKTPSALRTRIMQAFKNREVLQLVNVDLFGEGVNVPGMEVVSMARPTASFGLFVQQAFRPLTFAPGKKWGWIIDHVENFDRHGAPDVARDWAKYLKRRERSSRNSVSDTIPTRTCLHVDGAGVPCAAVYERTLLACPICGTKPVPAGRGGPEQVDGDLFELDPEALRKLFGEIARIDGAPVVPYGADRVVQMSVRKAHAARQDAQAELRRTIALWAGWQMGTLARSQAESYRRFFFRYGRDVATACTLGAREAEELRVRIQADLDAENVVDSTVISA